MFVNEKGQAFDVFKILIGAIVALAILGVLMPLVTNLNIGSKAEDEINALMQRAFDSSGTTGKEITFNEPLSLSKESFANKLGYTTDKICFGTTTNAIGGSQGLNITADEISYGGRGNFKVQIIVSCKQSTPTIDFGSLSTNTCNCGTETPCCGVTAEPI